MRALVPLSFVLPVLVGCVVLAFRRWLPRIVTDLICVATAATVAACTGLLAAAAGGGRIVEWMGGFTPHRGYSVGIVLVVDPLGAGVACLAAVLTGCALLYGWRYLSDAGEHYHVLMLLFLAAMVAFACAGDLFTLFVFFELMGAVAYALTGMRIEEPESVQGGLTFGVVNSLGAYLTLMGIGVLYARYGQLGLAQLGAAIGAARPDPVLVAAFCLACCGFLVKAAVVPMHFWLADAHAVAPTPVCVLFSGVMVELGVYAVTRIYWVVFATALPAATIGRALLVFGVLTALLGAVMCVSQRHLKRLLAYSTIAHLGLFLVGVATLDADGLAGTAVYVLGHSGVKAALFLLAGILLNRYRSVDEAYLHGRAGLRSPVGWLYLLAGLALAGVPPFGPGLGKALTEEAAGAGHPWLVWLFVAVSALTGGAVLRSGLRIFAGLGRPPGGGDEETTGRSEESETTGPVRGTPVTMLVATCLLLGGGLVVGTVPGLARACGRAAAATVDTLGYRDEVLHGALRPLAEVPDSYWSVSGVLLGLLSAVLAVGVALLALARLPARLRRMLHPLGPVLVGLHRLHSGHVGDYVAWLFLGTAALAALVAW
ncbi:complex I subunit 5 family protein [Actinocatenispora sera]|uniref:complex I subunit 5 family protein n=1 Tax=Actinocatenispora sera TaxID=390989 RepID=UPI0033C86783